MYRPVARIHRVQLFPEACQSFDLLSLYRRIVRGCPRPGGVGRQVRGLKRAAKFTKSAASSISAGRRMANRTDLPAHMLEQARPASTVRRSRQQISVDLNIVISPESVLVIVVSDLERTPRIYHKDPRAVPPFKSRATARIQSVSVSLACCASRNASRDCRSRISPPHRHSPSSHSE